MNIFSNFPKRIDYKGSFLLLIVYLIIISFILSGCFPVGSSQTGANNNSSNSSGSITLKFILVTPSNLTILVNGTQQYAATAVYSDNSTVNVTNSAVWASSDTTRVVINTAGLARGLTTGSTTISASYAGITGSTPLLVSSTAVIPNPPADDANYFQVMIVNNTTGGHSIHLSYVANKMLLTNPAIEGITWLTGGGAGFNNWNTPQMLLVDSSSGNTQTGANFYSTYDIPLNSLPLDATLTYRVLKIPYLMPGDNTRSLAGSGRLFITFDSAAPLAINTSSQAGGYAFQQPSPSPNGVGSNLRWDFVEINNATPSSNGKNVSFVDTTNVDFFSLGLVIKGRLSDTTFSTFGLDTSITNPVTSCINALNQLPADYKAGYYTDGSGNFLRFLAPDLSFTSNANDLDHAINDGYNYYKRNNLEFSVSGVNYLGTTSDSAITFTLPYYFVLSPKPTTLNVIASTGPFDTGSTSDANIQNAMKYCAAYFNRGVFTDTSLWNTPSSWYPSNVQYNQYAQVLHQRFIHTAVYGFSYDDVPSSGILTVPAISTCTSMTLVILNN